VVFTRDSRAVETAVSRCHNAIRMQIPDETRYLRNRRQPRRLGISMVEIVVMLAIVTVALGMFARTMSSTRTLDPVATENAIAASAMRSKLEELRNHPFHEVFQRYNDDPSDDPDGPGTAPGAHFAVEGLTPPAAVNAFCGTIVFPAIDGKLREDVVDPMLGMPRDLNADGDVDALDHTSDNVLLPIRIRVDWIARNTKGAARHLEIYTMYARF